MYTGRRILCGHIASWIVLAFSKCPTFGYVILYYVYIRKNEAITNCEGRIKTI